MRLKQFCRTGLFVSELCLGTMTFGGEGELWQKIGTTQQADAEKLIGRALGTEVRNAGGTAIAVGRDGRLSGPELAEARRRWPQHFRRRARIG